VSDEFTVRRATPDDVLAITRHRRCMFIEMGFTDPASLDEMSAVFEGWVHERLAREEYLGWLMLDAENFAVSGAGLWLRAFPPGPGDMCLKRGHIMNVYTFAEYRRRGFAGQLVRCAVEWCQVHGINGVTLNYTEVGRPIYEALGFKDSNLMFMWAKDLVEAGR
jgi:GNAT superfamily N-acetyltransferase